VAIQEFYPYAEGGPVSYTATAGAIGGHPYAAGWRQADPSVVSELIAWGLPSTDAGAVANDGHASDRSAVMTSAVPVGESVVGMALAGLALVGAAAAILPGLRRRFGWRRAI
jgi:hypothetical protein